MESKGRFRKQDGGERVQIPLMHAQNSTADIYSNYGQLDTTPQDGITSAFYDWSQLSVSISISRKEERQNAGKARILSLLQAKTQQSEASIRQLLNNCVTAGRITASANLGQFFARIGRLDSGATGPLPLAVLVDSNASRSVSVGNINGNTYSFWRNQARSSTGTTFNALKAEMNRVYNDCSRGIGGSPDAILTRQIAWETYFNALQSQERYVNTKAIDVFAGADGSKDTIMFRGATMVWDEVVPDTETTFETLDNIGTDTVDSMFFLNSEAWEWVVDSETDFITTPFVRPENQDARVAQILWMGAIGINSRRKNGVLYGISQSITS